MKTCLLLLFLSFSSVGFSQLLNKDYVWNDLETEKSTCLTAKCGSSTYYATHSYHLGKDTIIKEKNYKVLIDTIYSYDYKFGDSIGFIREETDSKKTFLFSKYQNKEILLYDFSLQLGNEFLFDNYWNSFVLKVTSVDNFDYNGVKRLTLTLSDGIAPSIVWIEGVGAVQGFLYPQYYDGQLLCVKENQNLFYKNAKGYDCITTGNVDAVNEIEENKTFVVYPNPASDDVTIKGNGLVKTVEIMDMYGNKLYSDHPNTENPRISVEKFKKGIYLMKINGRGVKLIIK